MTGCLFSWVAALLSAGATGLLLGVYLGRAHGRAHGAAPRAAGGDRGRCHLAAVERENERLRGRVQTLEAHLRLVVGRGCIITVDERKPQR